MTNLYRKKHGDIVGVDIGATSIKVVKLSKGSNHQILVDNYAIFPIEIGYALGGDLNKKDAIIQLKKLIASLKLSPKKTIAATAIPGFGVLSGTDTITREMSRLEIEQYVFSKLTTIIGSTPESIFYDFELFKSSDAKTEIEVTAIPNDYVNERVGIIEEAGLVTKVVVPSSTATIKALPYFLPKIQSNDIIGVFDIGAAFTNFIIYKENQSEQSVHQFGSEKLVNYLVNDKRITADEAVAIVNSNKLYNEEYREALNSYFQHICEGIETSIVRSVHDNMVSRYSKIVLMGGGARADGLAEFLTEKLGVKTTVISNHSIQVGPSVDAEQFKKDAPSLITAIGLAAYNFEGGLNLLPWRDDVEFEKKKLFHKCIGFSVVLGCLIGLGSYTISSYVLAQNKAANDNIAQKTKNIEFELDSLKDVKTKRTDLLARMAVVDDLKSQQTSVVETLNTIVGQIPPHMFLTHLSKNAKSFVFEGRADDPTTVAEFMRSLKNSGSFTNIFMSSFLTYNAKDDATPIVDKNKISPEAQYGSFIVTADLLGKDEKKAISDSSQNDIRVRQTANRDSVQTQQSHIPVSNTVPNPQSVVPATVDTLPGRSHTQAVPQAPQPTPQATTTPQTNPTPQATTTPQVSQPVSIQATSPNLQGGNHV